MERNALSSARIAGETHLVVRLLESGSVTYFEAYTKEPGFLEELADFREQMYRSGKPDDVIVAGTFVQDNAASWHLRNNVLLLHLSEVRRIGEHPAVARPGQKRPDSSYRQSTMASGPNRIRRDIPAMGEVMTIDAQFISFSRSSKRVTVNSVEETRETCTSRLQTLMLTPSRIICAEIAFVSK